MIRPATPRDLDDIVGLGRLMASESPRWREMDYEPDKVAEMVGGLIGSERGIVYVVGGAYDIDGVIVGVVHEHFFTTVSYAAVVAFYVPQDVRGLGYDRELLAAFEGQARALGASELLLGVHTGDDHEAKARLFSRLGYERCGIDLRKPL